MALTSSGSFARIHRSPPRARPDAGTRLRPGLGAGERRRRRRDRGAAAQRQEAPRRHHPRRCGSNQHQRAADGHDLRPDRQDRGRSGAAARFVEVPGDPPAPGHDHRRRDVRTTASRTSACRVRYNLKRDGAGDHAVRRLGRAEPRLRVLRARCVRASGCNEFQVGVYAAKLFDRGVPGLFVSGRYGYGFVEKVVDISHNRSLADLEVGYFVSPGFRRSGMPTASTPMAAVDFPLSGPSGLPLQYLPVHDVIQRSTRSTWAAGSLTR